MYVAGSEADTVDVGTPKDLSTVITFAVAVSCFGIIATAGTATALYYEDYLLLGAFWFMLLLGGGYFTFQYLQTKKENEAAARK
jgi:hypothetical protein